MGVDPANLWNIYLQHTYVHIRDNLKTAYPKSVKYVKNMSKRRFLTPRLFKQKYKLKLKKKITTNCTHGL